MTTTTSNNAVPVISADSLNRTISMFLEIIPKGQARVRSMVVKDKDNKFRKLICYKAKSQRDYEDMVRWQMKLHKPKTPLRGPVELVVTALMPIPKNYSKTKQLLANEGCLYHLQKPDLDNIIKNVLDVLQPDFMTDDKQVTDIIARKMYGAIPGVAISLREKDASCEI